MNFKGGDKERGDSPRLSKEHLGMVIKYEKEKTEGDRHHRYSDAGERRKGGGYKQPCYLPEYHERGGGLDPPSPPRVYFTKDACISKSW